MQNNILELYIKDHPEQDVHLIDRKFGDGKQLFWLHFENQFKTNAQMFLVRLDSGDIENCHDRIDEVIEYLNSDSDLFFMDNEYEDYKYEQEETLKAYDDWAKAQFPKADLSHNNCYWGIVNTPQQRNINF